jgi:sortase A
LTIGLTLLAIFLAFRISGFVGTRVAMWQLSSSVGHASEADKDAAQAPAVERTDFRLWSQKRIEAYKQSLAAKFGSPLALLTIGRLSLQVPVFEGTDEPVLNRGVGRIAGTAKPGEAGNIGIAGHRDGFFRCLKDIEIGDRIELGADGRKSTYTVDAIRVVNPEDVGVLLPRDRPALTLVTCYPFYFFGSAPQRFIVHASMPASNAEPGGKVSSVPVRITTNNQPNKQEVER